MLKRVKKIQNIGRFKSCNGGDAEFDKITFLFGRNTYGKTTLGDILASISTGNVDAIKTRKSIPIDKANPQQTVELKFLAEGDPGETTIRLNGERWEPVLPGDLRLHVFDDGFYHTNLFAGRQFTRDTKVNFSTFVLGARGVAKAKAIAEKNKERADAVRERGKLLKAALADIENLPQFLAQVPDESAEALEAKVLMLRREYDVLLKQQKNVDKIRIRKNLNDLHWPSDFAAALNKLNQTLGKSLQTHHEHAREAIAEHIRKTFARTENAESWIRQGLSQNNGSHCQFCGQTLSDDALRLLDVYQKSFDTSFREHEQQVVQELASHTAVLLRERVNPQRLIIESNSGTVHSYPELEDDAQFQQEKQALDGMASELSALFARWTTAQSELQTQIDGARERKLAAPQTQVTPLAAEQMLTLDRELYARMGQYNGKALRMNARFDAFKATLLDHPLTARLQALVAQGKAEARKLERAKRSEQCSEYIDYNELITRLDAEIPALQLELVNEQSAYIEQFFERLNRFFVMFGSQDFQLEKGKDDSGHTPVYYLKVKLKNTEVSERDLVRVFSESDRRALALAVFWSSVDGLSAAEKSRTIVVLDDPVTSFDTGRMTSVHQAIFGMAEHLRQIIVFSHFEHGICNFLTTYRKHKHVKLLQIARVGDSSKIEAPVVEHFLRSEHERKRENILLFARGDINQHAAGDLRIFLEVEIGYRFAKQLVGVNEENLSDRINKLHEINAIAKDTATEAHEWRDILNPSHHIWTEADIEDQRHTASRFMDFIYHRLVPVSSRDGMTMHHAAYEAQPA